MIWNLIRCQISQYPIAAVISGNVFIILQDTKIRTPRFTAMPYKMIMFKDAVVVLGIKICFKYKMNHLLLAFHLKKRKKALSVDAVTRHWDVEVHNILVGVVMNDNMLFFSTHRYASRDLRLSLLIINIRRYGQKSLF